MTKNPRYANAEGGILVEQDDGTDLYLDAGELYERVASGEAGPVSEYTAPPPNPAPVPQVVSRFQARAALLNAGLLDQAEAAILNAEPIAQLAWQDAQEFKRNSPTIAAIAPEMGLTSDDLDDLFRAAAQMEA